MGCGCRKGKASAGGASLRTALANPAWDQVATQANRSMMHRTGALGRDAYWASGEADAVRVAELAPPVRYPTVMDFGCGDGRVTRHLVPLYRTVVAVDASRPMLRLAEANVGRAQALRLHYVRDDGARIGRRVPATIGGTVDVIVALGVLDHLPHSHAEQVLRNLAGTLRAGGLLIATLPLGDRDRDPATWSDTALWTVDAADNATDRAGLTSVGASVGVRDAWFVYRNGDALVRS